MNKNTEWLSITSPINESLATEHLNQSKRNFRYAYMKVSTEDRDDLKQLNSHCYCYSEKKFEIF